MAAWQGRERLPALPAGQGRLTGRELLPDWLPFGGPGEHTQAEGAIDSSCMQALTAKLLEYEKCFGALPGAPREAH